MKLTLKDARLIHALDSTSRVSLSRIGRKIRLSQQLISYKLKLYREKGILTTFFPLIDYSQLGYLNFWVFFKVNYINQRRFQSLISTLSKESGVVEIIECGGKYDLLLSFAAPNPSSFNKTMKEVIFTYPQLKNYTILTAVVRHYFPRTYLVTQERNTKDVVIGGDREQIVLDDTDKKILEALQKNAIAPSLEIARATKTTPKTVIARIKRLESRKIIKGYQPLLHLQALGYHMNIVFIRYHNLTPERDRAVNEFCMRSPHITEFVKLFGEWDAAITVETKTMEEFRNVYISLREQFEDIIQDSEDFPVFQTHKKQFLPDTFFSI